MRILIVSKEVWRNDQNGENTLTWMFSEFPSETEFAQIYCSEGIPSNTICNKYFKLSTSDIAKSIKNHSRESGEIITNTEHNNKNSSISKKQYSDTSLIKEYREKAFEFGQKIESVNYLVHVNIYRRRSISLLNLFIKASRPNILTTFSLIAILLNFIFPSINSFK